MVVLAGVEVLGSIQILHNHSLGMGVDGQGSVYDWAHKASLDQLFGRGLSEGGGTECVS